MTQEKTEQEREKQDKYKGNLRLAGTSYNEELSTGICKVSKESIIKKCQLRI